MFADPAGEENRVEAWRAASYVVGGLGVAAAIAGTVLWLTSEPIEQGAEPTVRWLGDAFSISW